MTNSNILQIRKIIFENFNEIDLRFNNDEIYELLKKNDNFDQSQTIDDLANDFKKIEDDGLVRCIAQNFTTQWFKIFDDVEKITCTSCNSEIYLGKEESRICPVSDCSANI
ncbi:hypothetical protein OAK02_03850 [Candidatus Nitrosopelagicus sp.]|nr:hypothetical protein [Candidatus Nitrosopelagicus sp.]